MSDGRAALLGSGFEESTSGGGIPVLRARGKFAGMDVNTKPSKDIDPDTGKPKTYKQVVHKITNLEVLEVREGTEFPFDSLEFFMSAATKEGSVYHAWVESIKLALPNVNWNEEGEDGKKVWASYAKIYDELLDGNDVELDRTQKIPARRFDKAINDFKDTTVPVWKVVSVGAATATVTISPVDAAIALVASVTNMTEFMGVVPGSAAIGRDPAFLMELAADAEAWLAAQVEAGTLVASGDWYSVV